MRSDRLRILPDTTDTKVILEVLTHSREMLHDAYPEALKFSFVADARLHQYLRCESHSMTALPHVQP